MEEQEFEKRLEELLAQDFSDGTESFRDELLVRCLAELNAAEDADALDDADLEMLAAAGGLAAALAEGRVTLARPTFLASDGPEGQTLVT